MNAVEESSASHVGGRLQRVASLLLALTLTAQSAGVASAASDPSGADTGEPGPTVELTGAIGSYGMSPSSETAQEYEGASSVLRIADQELTIASRILETLDVDRDPFADAYRNRLEVLLDEFFQHPLEQEGVLPFAAQSLAAQLAAARSELLEGAPTARTWTRLARVIRPGSRLTLPKRYLTRPVRHTTDIDMDSLAAASWARSVLS